MTAWLVFAAAGVGTYAARSVFIVAVGDRPLRPAVERALRNIGPAVLAALTASLLTSDGLTGYLTSAPEVAATVTGVVVGMWRRSLLWSFAGAMIVWAGLVALL